ncbi:MAG: hypothetical protein COV48_16440, partial [Elusimicrobia bacterium CG11_big_fil_rev_8_21_14_0_20_64_6]
AAAVLPADPWPVFYLGASLLARGRYERAVPVLADFRRRRPDSLLGHLFGGLAHELTGDARRAEAAYTRASRVDPTCPVPHLLRAHMLKDAAAAVSAAEDAFEAEPDYLHAALHRMKSGAGGWDDAVRGIVRDVFESRRDVSLSARYLAASVKIMPYQFEYVRWGEELVRAHPGRSWAWGVLGRALVRCPRSAGFLPRGLEALDKAVKMAPTLGWVYGWRGLARISAGRKTEALRDLNKCVERQKYYFWAYEWRGALLHALARPKEALKDLDRAVSTNRPYPFALNRRSLVRRSLGNFAGAAADLDEAFGIDARYSWVTITGRAPKKRELDSGIRELTRGIRREPTLPSLRAWRGQVRLQQRDFTGAFRDFDAALALEPAHALTLAWYGRGLVESGLPAQGLRRLIRAIELKPSRTLYRLWAAEAHGRAGQTAEALAALDDVLRREPRSWQAWQCRARILLDAGRARAALRCADRAISLEGRNADNYHLKATALRTLDRLPEAEETAEMALAISAHHGRAWILRADVRAKLGRSCEAIADYEHALRHFPFLFNSEQQERLKSLLANR